MTFEVGQVIRVPIDEKDREEKMPDHMHILLCRKESERKFLGCLLLSPEEAKIIGDADRFQALAEDFDMSPSGDGKTPTLCREKLYVDGPQMTDLDELCPEGKTITVVGSLRRSVLLDNMLQRHKEGMERLEEMDKRLKEQIELLSCQAKTSAMLSQYK